MCTSHCCTLISVKMKSTQKPDPKMTTKACKSTTESYHVEMAAKTCKVMENVSEIGDLSFSFLLVDIYFKSSLM